MASPRNQHCANCIGTLSFLIGRASSSDLVAFDVRRDALAQPDGVGRAEVDVVERQ